MYIESVHISHIRCIEDIHINFNPHFLPREGKWISGGWSVIIGDNGSGKSTILKAIAAALIEEYDKQPPFGKDWIRKGHSSAAIEIETELFYDDKYESSDHKPSHHHRNKAYITISGKNGFESWEFQDKENHKREKGFFSMSFAPIRKFTGEKREDWFSSNPYRSRHASLFNPNMAFTEITQWLKDERLRADDNGKESGVIKGITKLINEGKLLPNETTFESVKAEGLIFRDFAGNAIGLGELSDGFQSVLGIMFELIRQLVACYGEDEVFWSVLNDNHPVINCSGVVLIDEIDAHLHPTWQTKIGQWFTHFFPKLQFIVTTHSPLICRGCANEQGDIQGRIWKLIEAKKGNEIAEMGENESNSLIFGDILDAYDTDAFGEEVTRGQAGKFKQQEYRDLMYKSIYGLKMTEEEITTFHQLKSIFHSNVKD